MSKTLSDVRTEVLTRLGDTANVVWADAEITEYLQEGYDDFVIRTECLWTYTTLTPPVPYTGNYTGSWEYDNDYHEDPDNRFNRTEPWEDFYVAGEAPTEPANHTQSWEVDEEFTGNYTGSWESSYHDNPTNQFNNTQLWEEDYVSGETATDQARATQDSEVDNDYDHTGYTPGTIDLPTDLLKLERLTYDSEAIEPKFSTEMETLDHLYKTETEDDVRFWIWDQDGIMKLRLYPASGQTGTIKIEYYKRGTDLSGDSVEFDLPDYMVIYIRHFAMARALARESSGQDLELAGHFMQRYEIGVQRTLDRKSRLRSSRRARVLGGPSTKRRGIPLPRLPYNYGRIVRYR